MKTHVRRGRAAFTLVELMAVITIMVILAALVVGGTGFVQERQAKEKARVQIALISKALEEYKLDFGVYPGTDNTATGSGTSYILFNALYYNSDNDSSYAPQDTDQKVYIPEFDPANTKHGWTVAPATDKSKLIDPWGNEYRYRTAVSAVVTSGNPPVTSGGTANTNTQNPDFDLWSCGKDGLTKPGTPGDKSNRDDVKNF